MPNYVCQFFKIRVVFHMLISETESVIPQYFCISGTRNSLSDCSKIFLKNLSTGEFLKLAQFRDLLTLCMVQH